MRPHCPRLKDKAERIYSTLVTERAYRQPLTSSLALVDALDPCIADYKTKRLLLKYGLTPARGPGDANVVTQFN
jgi:hypothetical protein